MSNAKGGETLAQEEDDVRRIWKEYLEDLYIIHTQKQVAGHMWGFDGIQRGNYFGGEPIGRAEFELRVGI